MHRLEIAHDRHPLAQHEEDLRRKLKLKSLGLASLQRSIVRQQSRLLWLSDADAGTRFFHLHANSRQHKNHIRVLEHDGVVATSEEDKILVAFEFYDQLLGTPSSRTHRLDLHTLDMPSLYLHALDGPFSEEEVWATIRDMPSNKVPRPDGFTSQFL